MSNISMIKELREETGAGMLDCKKALEENNGEMEASIDWLREKGVSKAEKKASRIAAEGLSNVVIEGNKGIVYEINVETDFVSKNDEFKGFIARIGELLIKSSATTLEEALLITTDEGTLKDTIMVKTAKIGEKISFRRIEVINKADNEEFGPYLHMGGKIGVLVLVKNTTSKVAKDIAMHTAAMRPKYINRDEVLSEEIERERTVLKEQAINEGKPEDIAAKMVEGRINKYYKEICLSEQPFIKDSDVSVGKYIENNGGEIVKMIRFEVGEGMEKRNEDFACEVMNQING